LRKRRGDVKVCLMEKKQKGEGFITKHRRVK
jgi:hypothetical protein